MHTQANLPKNIQTEAHHSLVAACAEKFGLEPEHAALRFEHGKAVSIEGQGAYLTMPDRVSVVNKAIVAIQEKFQPSAPVTFAGKRKLTEHFKDKDVVLVEDLEAVVAQSVLSM